MKNVRIKVIEGCNSYSWWFGIFENRKQLMNIDSSPEHPCGIYWRRKSAAIRNAKAMAKRIGIPYDPEIIKQHGC